MCIMEVREGQRSSTIIQACAHNVNTVVGDLDMFAPLAERRGDPELAEAIRAAQVTLQVVYGHLRDTWAGQLTAEVVEHEHDHGTERDPATIRAVVDAEIAGDLHGAHRHETR